MIIEMKGAGAGAGAGATGEGALGAKTARACDSCLRRRARWFCGADDAFLCHGCDTLVHSANPLASRHERVRLQTVSAKVTTTAHAWHSGFTRKARTPRHHTKHLALQQQQQRLKEQVLFNNTSNILPLVPELGGEEQEPQPLVDDELCRVPVFDVEPFDAERLDITTTNLEEEACDLESFSEFDVDLAEFAANVESLLEVGSGLHEDSGQVFSCDNNNKEGKIEMGEGDKSGMVIKVKDEVELGDLESVFDMTSDEVFHWNIDHDHSHQEKECVVASNTSSGVGVGVVTKEETKRERFLRLNYEEVITAWTSQGSSSPWTTGNPPKFSFDDDCWQNFLGLSGADGEVRRLRGHLLVGISGDGGREARVSRYREKRRTRLFAKKIRYEVRKLNAEKRPRMKGRFVKRTSCFEDVGATDFPTYHHHHH